MTIIFSDRVLITGVVLVLLFPHELSLGSEFVVGACIFLWVRMSSLALSFCWDLRRFKEQEAFSQIPANHPPGRRLVSDERSNGWLLP
jgi:hypothetical protein